MSACDLKEMKALAYGRFLEIAKKPEEWQKDGFGGYASGPFELRRQDGFYTLWCSHVEIARGGMTPLGLYRSNKPFSIVAMMLVDEIESRYSKQRDESRCSRLQKDLLGSNAP